LPGVGITVIKEFFAAMMGVECSSGMLDGTPELSYYPYGFSIFITNLNAMAKNDIESFVSFSVSN